MTTTPIQYVEFDAKLLEHIRQGRDTFVRLEAVLRDDCIRITAELGHTSEHWRVIDRRLQAMKRQGIVRFKDGRWSVPDAAKAAKSNQSPFSAWKQG